jgi:hypothetical protein
MQASIAIFHADSLGVAVSEATTYSKIYNGNVELAIELSLLGVLAIAFGMRIGVGAQRLELATLAQNMANKYDTRRWFYLYGAAWAIATTAQSVALIAPGWSQPLLALAQLKWAFFYILAYATFVRNRSTRVYWMLAFALEFMLSLGNYFSDFRTVFVFSLFALVAAGVKLTPRRFIGMSVLGATVVALMILWTAIKPEYRTIARGSDLGQVVKLDYVGRLVTLEELVLSVDRTKLASSVDGLLQRIAAVDLFGVVLETVPRLVPYQEGAIWADAVARPFLPRVIFPSKLVIDESEQTNKYTLLNVAGLDRGTSIGIGYMAESYIDFGEFGMMLPIFGSGIVLGWTFRWMSNYRSSRGLLGTALGMVTCVSGASLETSIAKHIGFLIVTGLASWLIMQFVAPRWFPWALVQNRNAIKRLLVPSS